MIMIKCQNGVTMIIMKVLIVSINENNKINNNSNNNIRYNNSDNSNSNNINMTLYCPSK